MMQEALSQINKIAGVRGSLLVGADGLVVASDLSSGEDPQTLGAVTSTVIATLTATIGKLDRGRLNGYILSGSQGNAVLWSVGETAQVLVLLRRDVNMGLVLVEMREQVKALEQQVHF